VRGVAPARTLAIVGSHPAGLDKVPWYDPDVEILVFNEAPLKPEKYPRWDAVLQIHGPEVYSSPKNWVNPDYWPWLQQDHPGKTIWMQKADPRVPQSCEYPLEGVLSMIPYRYLRSSPAAALALGIYLGYQSIALFGSELSSNTEYAYQAINYAFWIGLAHGRGIDLQLMCWQSEFMAQELYGWEGELQLSRDYFTERAAEIEESARTNRTALERMRAKLDTAMLECKFDEVSQLIAASDAVAQAAGETDACLSEAQRYAAREDMISRQEFERTSARAQQDGDQIRSSKDKAFGKAEYVWNVWKLTGRHDALAQLRVFVKEQIDLAYQVGRQYGTFRENINYMTEYDARLRAAGGVRALGR
jgi:hypothetical protein